ncbi:DUF3622 domain-containing protein [Thalassotalea psychrophila]|uniref:DUF3622 domain-containing protein n=1 Tax=Thalassotalea psychrophila TaxID=3065647 RepID=A0ABY9TXR0_9GAMM|nr:DUF3622 domain-containing protein [Colwelliaceae bacterium SQ149]
MAKSQKYSVNVVEQSDNTWCAKIERQITSKKKVVSKQQDGFTSESEATTWAEQELASFISAQQTSNKRHGEQRSIRDEKADILADKQETAKFERKEKARARALGLEMPMFDDSDEAEQE